VFAAHAAELRAVLTRVLGDPALAEDCVQDTAMRLLDADFAGIREPKAFMFQVGYNLARDALRRRMTRGPSVDDADAAIDAAAADEATPEVQVLAREQLAEVQQALTQLPEQRRRVLWLVRVEGLSLKETANALGISAKTVENHMTQALRQLGALLGRRPP
jgi:RNA polymerase sigma-70 factor (ECF subfamily)